MKYKYVCNSFLLSITFFYITLFLYSTFFYQLYKLYNYFIHSTSPIILNITKVTQSNLQPFTTLSIDQKYPNYTPAKNIIDHTKLSEDEIDKIFIFNFTSPETSLTKKSEIHTPIKQSKKNIDTNKKKLLKKKLIEQKNKKAIHISKKIDNSLHPKKVNFEKKTTLAKTPSSKQLSNPIISPKNIIIKDNNISSDSNIHLIKNTVNNNVSVTENNITDKNFSHNENNILKENNENFDDNIITNYVLRILKKIHCYVGRRTNHDIIFFINDKNHIAEIKYTPKKPSLSFQIHIENILKNEKIPLKLINQELALKI